MEKLFMSAGVVATIVLCLVAGFKLPFNGFKKKHPNWYKAIFTLLSVILSIGLSVLNELYILCGDLLSFDFATLVCVVLAGVFSGYNGVYEGLGLKELVKKLKQSLKKARELAEDKKTQQYLDKYLEKSGDIDKVIAILEAKKNKDNEV